MRTRDRADGCKMKRVVVIGLTVAVLLASCSGGQSLSALSRNAMASPELSFVEPLGIVEVERRNLPASALSTPARFTTFFEFDSSQRDAAVEELLDQAVDAGFELENQLPDSDWPLAKYKATNGNVVLTITVSAMNAGVELV